MVVKESRSHDGRPLGTWGKAEESVGSVQEIWLDLELLRKQKVDMEKTVEFCRGGVAKNIFGLGGC